MTNDEHARNVVKFFINTFNAQDHEQHALALNYPHIRLANVDILLSLKEEDSYRAQAWHNAIA